MFRQQCTNPRGQRRINKLHSCCLVSGHSISKLSKSALVQAGYRSQVQPAIPVKWAEIGASPHQRRVHLIHAPARCQTPYLFPLGSVRFLRNSRNKHCWVIQTSFTNICRKFCLSWMSTLSRLQNSRKWGSIEGEMGNAFSGCRGFSLLIKIPFKSRWLSSLYILNLL